MNIKENVAISVYNYSPCTVCATSQIRSYRFDPCRNDIPTIEPMSFSEIQHLNSKSAIFREGYLFFDPSVEEEVYEALSIYNWKDILKNEDIEKIILNPTKDGLQKILDIRSVSYFERVRGIFTYLKNTKQYDISIRVSEALAVRYNELSAGKLKTDIVLSNVERKVDNNEIDELKNALEEQKKMIAEQKMLIDKLTKSATPKQTRSKKKDKDNDSDK